MPGKKHKRPVNQIKLIYNPEAGNAQDPTNRIETVTRLLLDQGYKVDVALAKPKSVATKIARKAIRSGYRTIVAMGGDGTIEAVARALVGTKARLGILPGGTENNIIRCLGIPDNLEDACRFMSEGSHRKIDVGQVKTKKKGKFYFIEVSAVGLVAAIFPEAKEIADGQIGIVPEVLHKIVQYEVPHMKVKIDGKTMLNGPLALVTISGTPTFGKAFLIAPEASLNDGLLDVNLFPDMNKAEILTYFTAISGNRTANEPKIKYVQARKITLSTKPKQPVMADGEMLGKGKIKIKVRKGALRVIAASRLTGSLSKESKVETHSSDRIIPASKIKKEVPIK